MIIEENAKWNLYPYDSFQYMILMWKLDLARKADLFIP